MEDNEGRASELFSMAKPDKSFPEKQIWGTWEELLLACAVHRYGTDSWESVAMEVQKRSSTLPLLTPLACQHKYLDLKRSYSRNEIVPKDNDETTATEIATVPWLDELRKLRVAELRREVERYDLSIISLQLKVKRLEEEREQGFRENEKEAERSDLDKIVPKDTGEEKKQKNARPNNIAVETVPCEESDRENRSINESNSTDPKGESSGTGLEDAKREQETVEPEAGEPIRIDADHRPVVEDSCNWSCDSMAKGSAASPAGNSERMNPEKEAGESHGLFESVSESQSGGGRGKGESSDAQSSASKENIGRELDEPGNGDQSQDINMVSVESQQLADFLEILRVHKFGSGFERRLQSQETPYYMNLIQQHIDLEMIRTRLEEDCYSGCCSKFFRDLLLLVNNAVVFFGKRSPEFMAAMELRQLVSREMALRIPKSCLSPKEESSIEPEAQTLKLDAEPSNLLAPKPIISVPVITCRKRSSIAAKASKSSSGAGKKRPQTTPLLDEKPALDCKQQDKSSDKAENPYVIKKRRRERSSLNARKSNRIVMSCSNSNANSKKTSDANSTTGASSKGATSSDNSESKKADKTWKKNIMSTPAKKQSAANFLNRMRRSSSSNNNLLLETPKSCETNSDKGKGEGPEQKTHSSGNKKGDARKDRTPRKLSDRRQSKEQASSGKRTIGRPLKRAAARSPQPVPAKRGREAGETEPGSSGHAKRRSRK